MAVLVLQSFAEQRRAPGGGAEQEPAGASVGRLPDEVADALEAEHRIERVEGHRRHAAGGVAVPAAMKLAMEPASVMPSSRIWPSVDSV